MFVLCFFNSYADEVYHVRVNESDSIKLIPLSTINSMSIVITDTTNFDYRISINGMNLVDYKIYADVPLYDKVGGEVRKIQEGFNVNFTNIDWLLEFLHRLNLVVLEIKQTTYVLAKL